jgi:7-carboxy-7-deazaguanine synthase
MSGTAPADGGGRPAPSGQDGLPAPGSSAILRVNEIFHSIQGESTRAGWPCVFVRLTGCNLRCAYCDTRYAQDREGEGQELSVDDILALVGTFRCRLVEVTGGEPLLQAGTPDLVLALLSRGHEVLVETNGSLDIDLLDPRAVRIVDMKGPSSGEEGSNDLGNLGKLTPLDEVKFVIADREDYRFARAMIQDLEKRSTWHGVAVNLSPAFGRLAPADLAAWMLADRLQARLNLQLHKHIWAPETRGV